MKNASMIGQALPAIEFPYPGLGTINWSEIFPEYEKRMLAISADARACLQYMLDIDATEFAKQYTNKQAS